MAHSQLFCKPEPRILAVRKKSLNAHEELDEKERDGFPNRMTSSEQEIVSIKLIKPNLDKSWTSRQLLQLILFSFVSLDRYLLSPVRCCHSKKQCKQICSHQAFILSYLKGVCILWNASSRCLHHTWSAHNFFHRRQLAAPAATIQILGGLTSRWAQQLADLWNLIVEAVCRYCSDLITGEPLSTRVYDQTYGLYLSKLFKLYFKRQRCLLHILIIRNGSCKQDMYQRRTLSYVPVYAVGEFYLAEINAFCNKRDFTCLEAFVPPPLGEEICN